jgi:hypothetical protein
MQFREGLLQLAIGVGAVIAACVAGCSATRVTQPLPVGPDTYKVSSRTVHGGTAPARDAAVSAANQHCARLTNSGFNADEGVVDLTFRCLAAGDPELRTSR